MVHLQFGFLWFGSDLSSVQIRFGFSFDSDNFSFDWLEFGKLIIHLPQLVSVHIWFSSSIRFRSQSYNFADEVKILDFVLVFWQLKHFLDDLEIRQFVFIFPSFSALRLRNFLSSTFSIQHWASTTSSSRH